MKEFFLGLIPGSLLVYRYSTGFRPATIVGLALMELGPYVAVAAIEGLDFKRVVYGFALLYGVYEFGYLHNDYNAMRESAVGRTVREKMHGFRLSHFLLTRVPVLVALFWIWFAGDWGGVVNSGLPVLVLLSGIFLLHNVIKDGSSRVGTFLSLNALKVIFRLQFMAPHAVVYFAAAVPHLFVKLIHYLRAKGVAEFGDAWLERVKLGIYVGMFPVLYLVGVGVLVASLPYFLNHCKAALIKSLIRH